jgi:hypothetical protein
MEKVYDSVNNITYLYYPNIGELFTGIQNKTNFVILCSRRRNYSKSRVIAEIIMQYSLMQEINVNNNKRKLEFDSDPNNNENDVNSSKKRKLTFNENESDKIIDSQIIIQSWKCKREYADMQDISER